MSGRRPMSTGDTLRVSHTADDQQPGSGDGCGQRVTGVASSECCEDPDECKMCEPPSLTRPDVANRWFKTLREEEILALLDSERQVVRSFVSWLNEPRAVASLQQQVTRLSQENLRLRTIMWAAGEEIETYWDAHCDSEGFGPRTLLRHLQEGTGFYEGCVDKIRPPRSGGTE